MPRCRYGLGVAASGQLRPGATLQVRSGSVWGAGGDPLTGGGLVRGYTSPREGARPPLREQKVRECGRASDPDWFIG